MDNYKLMTTALLKTEETLKGLTAKADGEEVYGIDWSICRLHKDTEHISIYAKDGKFFQGCNSWRDAFYFLNGLTRANEL